MVFQSFNSEKGTFDRMDLTDLRFYLSNYFYNHNLKDLSTKNKYDSLDIYFIKSRDL